MFNKNEFRAMIVRKGLTMAEFAEKLGISRTTLDKRIKSDGNFNIKEINIMLEMFGKDEVMKALFSC